MADDPSLFGLHKVHLVKMSIASESTCVGTHMCVSPSESIQACVRMYIWAC